MSDVKINYYEILKTTPMWELDDMNKVALPIKLKDDKNISANGGNVWNVEKGKYVKSFGQTRTLKSYPDNKKEEFLLLVNGSGVLIKDLSLYKDEVDDCGCDGNPIATPTDLNKLEVENKEEHKELDKESAFVNKSSSFDKSGLFGFLLGAAIGGAIMWYSTKDKKKTIIGAIAGAFLGMIIGYFIGRRGTKKVDTLNKLEEIERISNSEVPVVPEEPGIKAKEDDSSKKGFFQLGETYELSIPYPIYALIYEKNTFYVASSKKGDKAILKPNSRIKGKLVEVKQPGFFVANPTTKKVDKIVSKKPLPYLDLGNNLYIPLAVVEPTSMISPEEAMKYLNGGGGLEDDVYVKGRYAGQRLFNLMYMPAHAVIIGQKYGRM